MLHILREIIKPRYNTLNRVEIKADRIIANYNYLRSLQPGMAIFPVLKSNAYGHGLREMCRILGKTDAPLVIVDSFPEAQVVYRHFSRSVLILGEMPLKAYDYCRLHRTEFVVYNEETLRYLAHFGKRARIHLFLNSGMNREGIQDLALFLKRNQIYLKKVSVHGFASHLASADLDSDLNAKQEKKFFAGLDLLEAAGFKPRWVHLGNSAYLLHSVSKPSPARARLTAGRSGLALYGYNSGRSNSREEPVLLPALEVFSQVVARQEIEAGEAVSYHETYRATAKTSLAVVPFGYFEGLDRRLSNRARFLIENDAGNFWAPVAGTISMNLTCLDVGGHLVSLGDQVKIISSQCDDPNSIMNIAALLETIPYEVLVGIQANIRRVIK